MELLLLSGAISLSFRSLNKFDTFKHINDTLSLCYIDLDIKSM